MIQITEDGRTFHIQTKNTSYVLGILDSGHLGHYYYGPALRHRQNMGIFFRNLPLAPGCETSYSTENPSFSLDVICREECSPGKGDYRSPSVILQDKETGDETFDFLFHSYEILEEKAELPGLPSSRKADDSESRTLKIILKDRSREVFQSLCYTSFPGCDVITRSCLFENRTDYTVNLDKIMSCSLDMNLQHQDFISLNGAWIRERHLNRRPLGPGITSVGSRRGVSSSDHNPFIALADKSTTEQQGSCYGFSLVYSGNHNCLAEVSPQGLIRIQLGIQSETFRWLVNPGESFQTPEAVLSFSSKGLSNLSSHFHRFVQNHIVRGYWQNRKRPILINNWEATYFDFTEKKLLALAREASALGIELFVLDDGWFGNRNNDSCSLGDWQVNLKKLPGGLKGLQEKIRKMGMDFGLWVEPEMISLDSNLYRSHPDWMVRSPLQEPSPGRNQYLLDLTRKDVCDYITSTLKDVFSSADIRYVKWDMNRNFSDLYSSTLGTDRQQEFSHRYVLGLYGILENLTESFPEILFESCASGGNRFDLGMLCYMPQTWTSDDTDAVERLPIQYGTSFFAPPSTMGAHVSAVPNHQVLRETSLESRFNTAAFGVLGYELDLTRLTPFDKKVIKKQIQFYKDHRELIQFGEFSRIRCTSDGSEYLWIVLSPDRSEGLAGWYQVYARANTLPRPLPLPGLLQHEEYKIKNRVQYENIRRFGELINQVLPVDIKEGGLIHSKMADSYLYRMEEDVITAGGDFLSRNGYLPRPSFYGTGMKEGIIFMGDFGPRIFYIQKTS